MRNLYSADVMVIIRDGFRVKCATAARIKQQSKLKIGKMIVEIKNFLKKLTKSKSEEEKFQKTMQYILTHQTQVLIEMVSHID